MSEIYAMQLEEENEKLRRQLVAAQETIDYCGATWKEEINEHDVYYKLCLGNFCLAVIVNPFMAEYRCHVVKLHHDRWHWSDSYQSLTLESAKSACESMLGFGKKRAEETPPDDLKKINENGVEWMVGQQRIQADKKRLIGSFTRKYPKPLI